MVSEQYFDASQEKVVQVRPEFLKINPEHLQEDSSLKAINEAIEHLKVDPPELLNEGIEVARTAIQRFEDKFGLVKIEKESMCVAYLREKDFQAIYKALTGSEDVATVAGTLPEIEPVLIAESDYPIYYQASLVFHEFIHKYLDIKVKAETSANINGVEETVSEPRRRGLMVKKVSSNTDNLQPDTYGEVPNELGNFAYQKQFMEVLLRNNLFKDERLFREQRLQEYGFTNREVLYIFNLSNDGGASRSIYFHQDNIFFDKDGERILNLPVIAMQLADDLDLLCGKSKKSNLWLSQLLLQAKTDLSIQNEVREMIDTKMGNGFYRKLREAAYTTDSFLDIMEEVQGVVYRSEE